MMYEALRRRVPRPMRRYVMYFEAAIEGAVSTFAASLGPGSRVLDAGAGEGTYAPYFVGKRYVGVDLGIGDPRWDYRKLDVIGDLLNLPFSNETFDACLNVVTLEHLRDPGCALQEIARTLKPGGRILLIVPLEWEVHQAPHDYFRFTRYGTRYLLERAGFCRIEIRAVGGIFRLLSRRLLNGLQYFRGVWFVPAALFLAPAALVLQAFDALDRDRNSTLGYICSARKQS